MMILRLRIEISVLAERIAPAQITVRCLVHRVKSKQRCSNNSRRLYSDFLVANQLMSVRSIEYLVSCPSFGAFSSGGKLREDLFEARNIQNALTYPSCSERGYFYLAC